MLFKPHLFLQYLPLASLLLRFLVFVFGAHLRTQRKRKQCVVVRLVRADALLAGDILLCPNPACGELPGRAWQMIEALFAVPDKWLHVSLLHSWG